MYQCGVDVLYFQILLVYLVDFLVLQSSFFVIRVREVQQHILIQQRARRSFEHVGRLFAEQFRRVHVLNQRIINLHKNWLNILLHTPFSARILQLYSRNCAAWYQMSGWWPKQSKHCSRAKTTRLVKSAVSSVRSGLLFSQAMYFCQSST